MKSFLRANLLFTIGLNYSLIKRVRLSLHLSSSIWVLGWFYLHSTRRFEVKALQSSTRIRSTKWIHLLARLLSDNQIHQLLNLLKLCRFYICMLVSFCHPMANKPLDTSTSPSIYLNFPNLLIGKLMHSSSRVCTGGFANANIWKWPHVVALCTLEWDSYSKCWCNLGNLVITNVILVSGKWVWLFSLGSH